MLDELVYTDRWDLWLKATDPASTGSGVGTLPLDLFLEVVGFSRSSAPRPSWSSPRAWAQPSDDTDQFDRRAAQTERQ